MDKFTLNLHFWKTTCFKLCPWPLTRDQGLWSHTLLGAPTSPPF